MYATDPSRWLDYQKLLERWGIDDSLPSTWQRLLDDDHRGRRWRARHSTESTIDLSADLHGTTGHLIVVVSPTEQYARGQRRSTGRTSRRSRGCRSRRSASTRSRRNDELITWATNLRDGAPLARRARAARRHRQLGGHRRRRPGPAPPRPRPLPHRDEGQRRRAAPRRLGVRMESGDGGRLGDRFRVRRPRDLPPRRERCTSRAGSAACESASNSADRAARRRPEPRTGRRATRSGNELGHGDVDLNDVSGFDLAINVPAGAALGAAHLEVSVDDGGVRGAASVSFQIQEFRRPEFEVVTRAESAGPYVLTQPVTVAALRAVLLGRRARRRAGDVAGDDQLHDLHATELVAVHLRRVEAVLARRLRRPGLRAGDRRADRTRGLRGDRERVVLLPAARAEGRRPTPAAPTRPAPTTSSSTSRARSPTSR